MPNLNGLDLLADQMLNSNVRTILVSAYELKKTKYFKVYERGNYRFIHRKTYSLDCCVKRSGTSKKNIMNKNNE